MSQVKVGSFCFSVPGSSFFVPTVSDDDAGARFCASLRLGLHVLLNLKTLDEFPKKPVFYPLFFGVGPCQLVLGSVKVESVGTSKNILGSVVAGSTFFQSQTQRRHVFEFEFVKVCFQYQPVF